MKRKLFSTLLSAFALLLLMGAADGNEAELILAQEESAAADHSVVLETESEIQFEVNTVSEEEEEADQADESSQATEEEIQQIAEQSEPTTDALVHIDGQPAPIEIGRVQEDGVTYVSLAAMAKAMDESAAIAWNDSTDTVTVTTAALNLTARLGESYVVANGRYLYVAEKVGQNNGTVMVPLSIVTEAFGATLSWDAATGLIHVQRGTGALEHGDTFYNQDDLFWLSRIVHAESGNQPLEGRMGVANVVLNRVKNAIFPNDVHSVVAQKNQFSPYRGGALANRTPNEGSVVAAKLALDGGVVEGLENALWFDAKCSNSWAARHKTCLAVIEGHKFYG